MDGQRWDREMKPLDNGPAFPGDPPIHPGCLCVVLPADLDDAGSTASDFEDYMAQFSRDEKESVLGEANMRAYARGGIRANQLVQRSSLLALEALKDADAPNRRFPAVLE